MNWKPISFTDRGDNNTFRFILGNEIAIDAAKSGNISPWPDGSRFAKIAWQREIGRDGLLYPGKFVQVELMVKDAKGQQENEGWAWGRWRSLELKPYGKDATFVKECTGCHKPMKDDDYVYTMPLTQATVSRNEVVNNRAAILPDGLPQQPLGWNAITMYVDPRSRTISCLYGNDGAMHAINDWKIHSSDMSATLTYPPGAIMSLVTWSERDDPHWFGARIPDKVESVEFVQVVNATRMDYHRFTGTQTTEDRLQQNFEEQRIKFILALKPAALP
ncbi:MAG TPA: cytochrome P460 family protein [Alloacidobacterium sp.]|nr:cytochrome P460 family protein [Alloacidobacterium sp.]